MRTTEQEHSAMGQSMIGLIPTQIAALDRPAQSRGRCRKQAAEMGDDEKIFDAWDKVLSAQDFALSSGHVPFLSKLFVLRHRGA